MIKYLMKHFTKDWVYTNAVIRWTLKNAKHLDPTDTYYIEKATDDCLQDSNLYRKGK